MQNFELLIVKKMVENNTRFKINIDPSELLKFFALFDEYGFTKEQFHYPIPNGEILDPVLINGQPCISFNLKTNHEFRFSFSLKENSSGSCFLNYFPTNNYKTWSSPFKTYNDVRDNFKVWLEAVKMKVSDLLAFEEMLNGQFRIGDKINVCEDVRLTKSEFETFKQHVDNSFEKVYSEFYEQNVLINVELLELKKLLDELLDLNLPKRAMNECLQYRLIDFATKHGKNVVIAKSIQILYSEINSIFQSSPQLKESLNSLQKLLGI